LPDTSALKTQPEWEYLFPVLILCSSGLAGLGQGLLSGTSLNPSEERRKTMTELLIAAAVHGIRAALYTLSVERTAGHLGH
jgi:hypothetical protein